MNLSGQSAIKKKNTKKDLQKRVTDYFPVRKSFRKTRSQIEQEELERVKSLIRTGYNEDFLRIYSCDVKGRGVKAGRPFARGEFVVEYKGELIDRRTAEGRENIYEEDESAGQHRGCYMYFFKHKGRQYCVDATAESPFKGRLINHSCLKPNLKSKVIDDEDSIHLCLFANKSISIGDELLYDYGDRSNSSISNNPWLKHT